jgi:hypothetical protein
LEQGHDHQVHLHLSALPQSDFFCYDYYPDKDVVFFNLNKKNSRFAGWQINSWANVVPRYGRPTDWNSRVGSLAKAAETVSRVLTDQPGGYQPSFFRAGQWDLGSTTAEREKSMLALRESCFSADSSVTEGYNCLKRPFRFGAPVNRATYFTFRNNPERKARRISDAGMLEILPLLLPQGNHAVSPKDDPEAMIVAYRQLSANGRVDPGRHILLEIEHLYSLPDPPRTGVPLPQPAFGDWKRMEQHFTKIRGECPMLEGVGASEAICSWLDYYTPELIARLGQGSILTQRAEGGQRGFRFPIVFLGSEILTEEEREHELELSLPRIDGETFSTVRILRGGAVVFEGSPPRRGSPLRVRLSLSIQNKADFALDLVADSDSVTRADGSVATKRDNTAQFEVPRRALPLESAQCCRPAPDPAPLHSD